MKKNKNKFKINKTSDDIDDIDEKLNFIKDYRSPELFIEKYFIGLDKYLHVKYHDYILYKKNLENHDNCLLFIYDIKHNSLSIRYNKIYCYLTSYSKYKININTTTYSKEYINLITIIKIYAKKHMNLDIKSVDWWLYDDVKGGIKID